MTQESAELEYDVIKYDNILALDTKMGLFPLELSFNDSGVVFGINSIDGFVYKEGDKGDIEIFYDFTPEQPQTQTDPSWPEELEVTSIIINGSNILDVGFKDDCDTDIHESAESYLNEHRGEE